MPDAQTWGKSVSTSSASSAAAAASSSSSSSSRVLLLLSLPNKCPFVVCGQVNNSEQSGCEQTQITFLYF